VITADENVPSARKTDKLRLDAHVVAHSVEWIGGSKERIRDYKEVIVARRYYRRASHS